MCPMSGWRKQGTPLVLGYPATAEQHSFLYGLAGWQALETGEILIRVSPLIELALGSLGDRYLQEFAPLGTGGGLYHFRDQILAGSPEAFFVLNADVCSDFPLNAMLAAHRRQPHPFLLLGTTVSVGSGRGGGPLAAGRQRGRAAVSCHLAGVTGLSTSCVLGAVGQAQQGKRAKRPPRAGRSLSRPSVSQANRMQSLNYGCIVENPQTHEVRKEGAGWSVCFGHQASSSSLPILVSKDWDHTS